MLMLTVHRLSVLILAAVFVLSAGLAPTQQVRPQLPPGQTTNWTSHPVDVVGLATQNLAPPALSAADLAATIIGPGVVIQNVGFSGNDLAAGTFQGGTGILGFESGIVLSSGNMNSIVGPNTLDDTSTVNSTGSDPDLANLIPGYTVFDSCALEFDFSCPTTQTLTFQFVFASEEYNEWVNSPFNDVFGFFVNGQNIAIVPGTTTTPVSINNLNCNNPYAPPSGSHCNQFVNNDLTDGGGTINTEMDGLTLLFSATVNVNPGLNHIKLAIGDAGDPVLDSNVFIRAGSLTCGTPGPVCELPMPALELGAGPQVVTVGSNYNHPVRAIATNGLAGQQVTVTSVTVTRNGVADVMPANAAIVPALPLVGQPALGTFTWSPTSGQTGTWKFTYHLLDQLGATGQGTVQLDVPTGGNEDVEAYVLGSPAPGYVDFGGGDVLLVDFAQALWFIATETDLVEWGIPDDPALLGLQFYIQVGLFNPAEFPADPLKFSNGLHITVGVSDIQSYGTSSGITLWSTTPPLLDTDFVVEFLIW
jgi:hypothetical protein